MDVLVVDEDNAFASAAARALRKDGHLVVIANTGAEALERIRQSPPKLAMIDLTVGGINGLQLLLVLKEDAATAQIPVVVWSATVTEDITRQALAFGADAMLIKTRFSMGEMRRLVSRLVGGGAAVDNPPGMHRILVVEDDDGTREAVVKHLSEAGYVVNEAENGWEALLMLDREKFDLVVLDLVMPGMDGQTFLNVLRGGQKHNRIPVVVMTAFDVAEMRKLVEPLGVSRIMGKRPPLWDELVPAVKNVLEAA
jgi:CheY-like chemotaxis protein